MDKLVRFLVQELNTTDGRRDTATFYIDAAKHYEILRQEKRINRKTVKRRNKILERGPLAFDEEFVPELDLYYLNEEEKEVIRLAK